MNKIEVYMLNDSGYGIKFLEFMIIEKYGFKKNS